MKEQKKVVQADYPERLGIASLLGDNNYSYCLRLEHGLVVVVTLFVKGDIQGSAIGDRHRVHTAEILRGLKVCCLNTMWLKRVVVHKDDPPADRYNHGCAGGYRHVIIEGDRF